MGHNELLSQSACMVVFSDEDGLFKFPFLQQKK